MIINYELLVTLRSSLPRGGVKEIRDRLMKRKIQFSRQYIYRCLDPQQTAYNSMIIDEAILLCEESRKNTYQQEERVLLLNHTGE